MGLEEDAVFYLLQRANDEHWLRSAFTLGTIHGWIYLEAIMDDSLLQLLKLTPGIIQSRRGALRHMVDPNDWIKTLTMHDLQTVVKVGDWV